jgi:hypothetical protein
MHAARLLNLRPSIHCCPEKLLERLRIADKSHHWAKAFPGPAQEIKKSQPTAASSTNGKGHISKGVHSCEHKSLSRQEKSGATIIITGQTVWSGQGLFTLSC